MLMSYVLLMLNFRRYRGEIKTVSSAENCNLLNLTYNSQKERRGKEGRMWGVGVGGGGGEEIMPLCCNLRGGVESKQGVIIRI